MKDHQILSEKSAVSNYICLLVNKLSFSLASTDVNLQKNNKSRRKDMNQMKDHQILSDKSAVSNYICLLVNKLSFSLASTDVNPWSSSLQYLFTSK